MSKCKLCNGRLDKMGKLASLVWFVCRNCGMLFTKAREVKVSN
jgi:hypothetical protein